MWRERTGHVGKAFRNGHGHAGSGGVCNAITCVHIGAHRYTFTCEGTYHAPYSHAERHADGNEHTDGDLDAYGHPYADPHPESYPYAAAHSYARANRHLHIHADVYADPHINAHPYAQANRYTASADSHAASGGSTGC